MTIAQTECICQEIEDDPESYLAESITLPTAIGLCTQAHSQHYRDRYRKTAKFVEGDACRVVEPGSTDN